jgi:glutamine amidotransferase
MCRWLAYNGPPIFLDTVLFKPENSLIQQSLRALQSRSVTNGDGFGLGWYGARRDPGLYRDTLPAWNDDNLRSLAEQIRAGMFFAHVRATTGTPTARSNCHPFRFGHWLFMHNGQIGEFEKIRRDLAFEVHPTLFHHIKGSTDSEIFFYLLMGAGLGGDPLGALARAIDIVEGARLANSISEPFLLTAAFCDGETIYAVRYASEGNAPTLYYACGVPLSKIADNVAEPLARAIMILSEPLDPETDGWVEVPAGRVVIAGDGAVSIARLRPAANPAMTELYTN